MSNVKTETETVLSQEVLAKSFLSLTPKQRRDLLENNTASEEQKAEVVKSLREIQDRILEIRKEISFLYDNYENIFKECGVSYSHMRMYILDELYGHLEKVR